MHAIAIDASLAGANPTVFYDLIDDLVLPYLPDNFIVTMTDFAEAIAKACKRDPNLCHYDVTSDAEILMPGVFEVLKIIRKAITESIQ